MMNFIVLLAVVKVACIGDSITYGTGLAHRQADCYPRQLQLLLDEWKPGAYEVRNFGNPGRGVYLDTMRGKEKRGYRWTDEHAQAMAWKPDIVICNLGINDRDAFGKELSGERRRGQFVDEYLLLLGDYAKAEPRPKFYIWTKLGPLTAKHKGYGNPFPVKMRADLETVARRANAVGIDMHTPLLRVIDSSFEVDGIHPDAAGARLIAQVTFGELAKDRVENGDKAVEKSGEGK